MFFNKKVKDRIKECSEIRDRISFLRIGDDDFRKTLEYFLLVSGQYLDTCRELKTYSPKANHEFEEVLQVCQIFLKELDATSTENRYGIEDKGNYDFKTRTIETIKRSIATIQEEMELFLPGITEKAQLEIIEEMDKE